MSVQTHSKPPVELSWNGTEIFLFSEHAALLKSSRTLLIADLHLGKDEAFRASGIPVPEGPAAQTLQRLSNVLIRTQAQKLVILGDLFHADAGQSSRMFDALAAWRERHPTLPVVLVRGNHDRCRCDPCQTFGIKAINGTYVHSELRLQHAPPTGSESATLCGHVHPAVRLRMRNGPRSRLPCFYFTDRVGILPAFGDFTGHGILPQKDASRIFVIAGEHVLEVPGRHAISE